MKFAQRLTNPLAPKLSPSSPEEGATLLSDFIQRFITLILIVAALVFLFVFLTGGIQWISSGGDKAKTEAARGRITNALVGLVIIFAFWAILKLIQSFFGVTIININLLNLAPGR